MKEAAGCQVLSLVLSLMILRSLAYNIKHLEETLAVNWGCINEIESNRTWLRPKLNETKHIRYQTGMLTKLSFLRWGSTFRWFSQRGCQQLTFFRKLIFCSTSFLCEGEWLRIDRFGQPCLPAVTVIIMHQVCLLLLLRHAAAAEGQGCRINFTVNQLQFAALTFTLAGKLSHQFWVKNHWSSGVWCVCVIQTSFVKWVMIGILKQKYFNIFWWLFDYSTFCQPGLC